jgi:hypothetical protein
LALDAVLGDHRQQYARLRDFAQIVIDTNLGSRMNVTTVTPPPPLERILILGPHSMGYFPTLMEPKKVFLRVARHL